MTNGVASRKQRDFTESVERACEILRTVRAADRNGKEAIDTAIDMLKQALEPDRTIEPRTLQGLQKQDEHPGHELARTQLELRRRDDFLAVVTHELRNPIATLAFAADLLLTEAKQDRLPSGDVLLRRFEILNRQIRRLMSDLDRLLDFTRIRSGRLDLRLEEIDLTDIVREVVTEMKPQLDRCHCELRLASPRPERGVWDSMRLRQIIWNLISNATKFGAGAPVEVAVDGDENKVRLSVRDYGAGIAEQERERIFERFEQAAAAGRQTGFGVGLWVVKRIVDALGGDISLESETGHGAMFAVTLPRRRNA